MSLATAPTPTAKPQDAALLRHQDGLVMDGAPTNPRVRLLIEDWLPIAALSEESVRERRSMTALPPVYYLHVWWARRPLVASRAAVLASLLPSTADHKQFMHMIGIHGDPVTAKQRIAEAKHTGEDLGDVYGYRRAFTYTPSPDEVDWAGKLSTKAKLNGQIVLDPTAGGGSIPFESMRLGADVIANDLNPVAWLVLKATVEYPKMFGGKLLARFKVLAARFQKMATPRFVGIFPVEKSGVTVEGYLWARTIRCPYCDGKVPLSPNWKLNKGGRGVKLVPHIGDPENRHCTFEIVEKAKDHSAGTIKAGDAVCPYPDCVSGKFIKGEKYIKPLARKGELGQQLYAVVYKEEVHVGMTAGKNSRPKTKNVRSFRAPRPEDNNEAVVRAALDAKMPEWLARDIIPTEDRFLGDTTDRVSAYGEIKHTDMFAPRQLYGHAVSAEVFIDLYEELTAEHGKDLSELDRAAMLYLATALDKLLNYNSRHSVWLPNREVVANTFNRHSFTICWSHAEMAPAVVGLGHEWAVEQTGKALEELIKLIGSDSDIGLYSDVGTPSAPSTFTVLNEPAQYLTQPDASVDCVVMDPPYYDNVMYAELSDFFYVWLKRTAGRLFPEMLGRFPDLTDKEQEAVANPTLFKDQKGAREKATRDYEDKMAAIFDRCRQVLKPTGVMTVMFTHKSSGAWDALASGIVRAGFVITASWPVNTEAESSLHIKEKSAAKSTIFLVCRPRDAAPPDSETVYWEDVEPKVVEKVRERVGEFQAAGIAGVDLYLACFGPALQVFSEYWPLNRGRAAQPTNGKPGRNGKAKATAHAPTDPYAVRPEDALDAARREVKRWRMETLATVKRKHHLDPLTEWYALAWDTFKAPRFSADEALRLARVVGLDFDRQVKNVVCEVKGDDVALWDSKIRKEKGKLGPVGEGVMLDTLHHAAFVGREQNTGAALVLIQQAKLADDPTLLTTLEVLLNVLPPPGVARRVKKTDTLLSGAASDFEALEKLRQLAFVEKVPKSIQPDIPFDEVAAEATDDEDADANE